jgi:hypothetical protein
MQTLIQNDADVTSTQNMGAVFQAIDKAVALPQEEYFSYVMESMVMTELYKLMLTGRSAETDVLAALTTIKNNVDEYYQGIYGN